MSVLPAHLVFITTYRHQVFTAAHPERLEQIMRDACTDSRTGLTGFNGEPSHVHLHHRPEGRRTSGHLVAV